MAGRGTASRPGGVEAAAEELYGLPLDEFTAARTERAKQARAHGDNAAAAAIGKLAKPNKVAWLANQLVREHPDELRPLLELGDSMRQATASLDAGQLRQASRQQHQVIYALVQQARRLASAAGQAVSDSTARGLEDTLHAALADEQAARQLSQGRLTSGLARSGFPFSGIDIGQAPASAGTTARGRRPQPGTQAEGKKAAAGAAVARRREQEARARQDEDDARDNAAKADRARENAQATLAQAQDAARAAADQAGRLQAELDAALEARTSADRAQRQARKDADRADRVARNAERRLADATARRMDPER